MLLTLILLPCGALLSELINSSCQVHREGTGTSALVHHPVSGRHYLHQHVWGCQRRAARARCGGSGHGTGVRAWCGAAGQGTGVRARCGGAGHGTGVQAQHAASVLSLSLALTALGVTPLGLYPSPGIHRLLWAFQQLLLTLFFSPPPPLLFAPFLFYFVLSAPSCCSADIC